jgi:hypothetical protein
MPPTPLAREIEAQTRLSRESHISNARSPFSRTARRRHQRLHFLGGEGK